MFVRALGGEHAKLGIGKEIRRGDLCTVEFFDAPTAAPIVFEVPIEKIARATIPEQTRVYHYNTDIGAWEIGRLLDDHGDRQLVQFPNKSTRYLNAIDVFVRWSKPIADPTPFLANRINESPRFSDGRSAFQRSQVVQRGASLGISALLSSAIELEGHQIEVVRRVLQDPVQRYLLADEVGLGKTIEAGLLIRQCVLDCGDDVCVVVIVPDPLVTQWCSELTNKFFLGGFLSKNIHVVASSDLAAAKTLLADADMLVIDEAHHLTDAGINSDAYRTIASIAPLIDRVLLLSATPALHNEDGFLAMLHLLDPATYPLDGIDAFRRKIESRQSLAEIVAGLIPENALYLDHTIDALANLFPDDALLQNHGAALRQVIETMPSEEDPALVEAIARVRAHLSEVYRLHRRIVRHRRRNVGGLTPDRLGAEVHRYASSDRAALTAAIDDWRFQEAIRPHDSDEETQKNRNAAYWQVADRTSQYPAPGNGLVRFPAQRPEVIGDLAGFARIATLLARPGLFADRADAVLELLPSILAERNKVVVFCSDAKTADALFALLSSKLGRPVDRHDPHGDAWKSFNNDPAHCVLVCDRLAEEGLNLQGGRKVVVHYDTPLSPNRIEQRLGRVDRYGSGASVRSFLLVCEDDPLEAAWTEYLCKALRLFDRSVASLQYVIERTVQDLAPVLFVDGPEALDALTHAHGGVDGVIEREIRAIDQQDALDALGSPPTELVDRLCDVDDAWQQIADDTTLWLENTLMFGRILENDGDGQGDHRAQPFRYQYCTGQPHTLLPLTSFMAMCASAVDLKPGAGLGRRIKTVPYSFRRRTALNRKVRDPGMRLLRYGEPLLNGIGAITDGDDRGRSFAMWREDAAYGARQAADVFLRFDFLVDPDLDAVRRILVDWESDSVAARAALRRRGDMALAPFFTTVWLDAAFAPVTEGGLLGVLERPYRPEGSSTAYRDVNVNAQRWKRVERLNITEVSHWAEFCTRGRNEAENLLRTDSSFVRKLALAERDAAHVDHGRLSQLEARLRADPGEGQEQLQFERQLASALRQGIGTPKTRLETIGAVFLTGDGAMTGRILGGI